MRLSCTSCTYFFCFVPQRLGHRVLSFGVLSPEKEPKSAPSGKQTYTYPVVGCASGVVKELSLISWASNPVDQILSLFEKESKRALRRRWFTYVHTIRHTLILIPIANVNIASGRGEMRCRCNFYYPNNHNRPPLKDLSPRG